jgi:hypothetical protein
MESLSDLKGMALLEVWEGDKFLYSWTVDNMSTTVGRNYMLNTAFLSGTQDGAWYVGLIGEDDFDEVSINDTMSSHAGWVEVDDYNQANRQTWEADAASGGSMSNGERATFTINTLFGLKGIFITTSETKGGTSGTLFATAISDSVRHLVIGQSLKVSYMVTLRTST